MSMVRKFSSACQSLGSSVRVPGRETEGWKDGRTGGWRGEQGSRLTVRAVPLHRVPSLQHPTVLGAAGAALETPVGPQAGAMAISLALAALPGRTLLQWPRALGDASR